MNPKSEFKLDFVTPAPGSNTAQHTHPTSMGQLPMMPRAAQRRQQGALPPRPSLRKTTKTEELSKPDQGGLKNCTQGDMSRSANGTHWAAREHENETSLPPPCENQREGWGREDHKERKEQRFQLSHTMPVTENSEWYFSYHDCIGLHFPGVEVGIINNYGGYAIPHCFSCCNTMLYNSEQQATIRQKGEWTVP